MISVLMADRQTDRLGVESPIFYKKKVMAYVKGPKYAINVN